MPSAPPCLLVVVRPQQCLLIAPSRSTLGRRPWMGGEVVGGIGKVVLVIGRSLDLVLESLHAHTEAGTRPVHSTTWRDDVSMSS